MDKETILSLFIGGQSFEQFLVAFGFGLLGLLGSLLVQLVKSNKKIKTSGGFSLARWVQDNWIRTALSILIILVGAARGEMVTQHFGDWGPLGLGFMTDKVIEALIKVKGTFSLSKAP